MGDSGAHFDIELARRQAGRIARETGAGESTAPGGTSTPWSRLRSALDAAHVEPITGVQQDSYTAADGTIIYRKRVGSRVYCRRSGTVGTEIAGIGAGGSAGWIACPGQAEWKQESGGQ